MRNGLLVIASCFLVACGGGSGGGSTSGKKSTSIQGKSNSTSTSSSTVITPSSTKPVVPISFKDGDIQLFFSPNGGAEQAVVDAINSAKKGINVQTYDLGNKAIIDSLIAAHTRNLPEGVKVAMYSKNYDSKTTTSSANNNAANAVKKLLSSGAQFTSTPSGLVPGEAHNKIMIIDDTTVITGSNNFTDNSQLNNAENLLLIKSEVLTRRYKKKLG